MLRLKVFRLVPVLFLLLFRALHDESGYSGDSKITPEELVAKDGRNPAVICCMPFGWPVLGDTRVTPGSTTQLSDPVVLDPNALSLADRAVFLRDMSIIGDALLEITAASLINYEILAF